MTVDQLIERLVELARRGRSEWEVKYKDLGWFLAKQPITDLICEDENKEVVIE